MTDRLRDYQPASAASSYQIIERMAEVERLRALNEQADSYGLHPDDDAAGWVIEKGVTCVVCPACTATFDACHTDNDRDGRYSCPFCVEVEVERLRDVAARALEREMRADEDADRLAEALRSRQQYVVVDPVLWYAEKRALAAHDARKAEESDG